MLFVPFCACILVLARYLQARRLICFFLSRLIFDAVHQEDNPLSLPSTIHHLPYSSHAFILLPLGGMHGTYTSAGLTRSSRITHRVTLRMHKYGSTNWWLPLSSPARTGHSSSLRGAASIYCPALFCIRYHMHCSTTPLPCLCHSRSLCTWHMWACHLHAPLNLCNNGPHCCKPGHTTQSQTYAGFNRPSCSRPFPPLLTQTLCRTVSPVQF